MDSDNQAVLREPPVAGNEVDTLLGALERQRGYVAPNSQPATAPH
jgi:hypothetical protein